MNLKIREFKKSLLTYIDNVELPAEVKRLVLEDVYNHVDQQAVVAITQELKEREEAEKNAESV